VSAPPFDSLNVGDHVGDDDEAVARNRARLADAVGVAPPERWAWMQQVHGTDVAVVDAPPASPPTADALVTASPDLPLAVVTADCAPIALACEGAVGVVHAGHRGLLGGVVERAVAAVRAIGRGDVRALLGPCIRAPRYEFGDRDLEPLVASFGPTVASRTEWGTTAFDITEAVRIALQRVGVDDFHDTTTCTSQSPEYFSYRRDGVTGRQATIAVLA
jgi:YfiH family protein